MHLKKFPYVEVMLYINSITHQVIASQTLMMIQHLTQTGDTQQSPFPTD